MNNETIIKMNIEQLNQFQLIELNGILAHFINAKMLNLSKVNINNASLMNKINMFFNNYFMYQMSHPTLIVVKTDNKHYKNYLTLQNDVIDNIDICINAMIERSIKIGQQLLEQQCNVKLTEVNEENKCNDEKLNREMQLLYDELMFGDDTIDDAHDLNRDVVNVNSKYIPTQQVHSNQLYLEYCVGSHRLCKQIMSNVFEQDLDFDMLVDLNIDCPCIKYECIKVTDFVNNNIKITCIKCKIEYDIQCLNISKAHWEINKQKRMVCGICCGHEQFNLVMFVDSLDEAPEINY